MALDLGVTPTGRVEIQVGERRLAFDNLVLDRGWEALLDRTSGSDGAMVPTWLHFGTGDSDPDPADGGLEARANGSAKQAASQIYGGFVDVSTLTMYSEVVVRFDYAAGELTGDDWTELGLSYDQAYAEPYNRALIRDENGAPVPLVVLSDEPVTVYVRLRLYLHGWGHTFGMNSDPPASLGQLTYGGLPELSCTVTLDSNIADPDTGMWKKGFPVATALAGGVRGSQESFDRSTATATMLMDIGRSGAWSASRITYEGRSNAPMIHLDVEPALTKADRTRLFFRPTIQLVRG